MGNVGFSMLFEFLLEMFVLSVENRKLVRGVLEDSSKCANCSAMNLCNFNVGLFALSSLQKYDFEKVI